MLLEKILKQPADSPGLYLRDSVYGAGGQARLLQDVMGLANSSARGSRYIVFGVSRQAAGQLEFTGLDAGGLEELQGYGDIIKGYLEPDVEVEPFYGDIEGNLVGALELRNCINPPYLIKVDVDSQLLRGACWVREGGLLRPAQRTDLDRMYRSNQARISPKANDNIVQVGWGDDPSRAAVRMQLPEASSPPSKLAASRMHEKIEAKKAAADVSLEDTGFARLIHARLYGVDEEFEDQGVNTMVQGYNAIIEDYSEADDYYYFETNALRLNLCIVNSGHDTLEDVSLMLTFPRAEQFRVAERIYGPPGSSTSAKEAELMGYPRVKQYKSAIQVKQDFMTLSPDEAIEAFEQPLRIAVRPELVGKKLRVRYSVHAKGFAEPEEGSLTIIFGD